jgi:hypothetical protein
MLLLLLDAAVILGLVHLLNDGDTPGWGTAIATALALGFGFYGCLYFLGPYIGIFSFVPMAIVAGALLWLTCDVPLKKAMMAGGILLAYKLVLGFLLVSTLA